MTEIRFGTMGSGIYQDPTPSIAEGSALIAVHRGTVLPVDWECDEIHTPENYKALIAECERALRAHVPGLDVNAEEERFYTCPEKIAAKFTWHQEKWPNEPPD